MLEEKWSALGILLVFARTLLNRVACPWCLLEDGGAIGLVDEYVVATDAVELHAVLLLVIITVDVLGAS